MCTDHELCKLCRRYLDPKMFVVHVNLVRKVTEIDQYYDFTWKSEVFTGQNVQFWTRVYGGHRTNTKDMNIFLFDAIVFDLHALMFGFSNVR